jgi:uncharacterized protein
MRAAILQAVKDAMKSGDKPRLLTLRTVQAKIKDADIAARPAREAITEPEVIDLLAKLVKQRRESIALYTQGGRADLVAQETAEIAILEEFLPKQMDDAGITAAISAVIKDTGAASVKDMGKVMALIKEKYAGQMDFAKASAMIKGLLSK